MKRKLDDIGPTVAHKLLAAEVGRPGSNLIPQITIGNRFHSIRDVLDTDEELKSCIILGFSRDGNHLISYTPQACLASDGKDGFNLQLWTFTPSQPCRKLWSLPLFNPTSSEDDPSDEDNYAEDWMTWEVNVYETTDSCLFIIHCHHHIPADVSFEELKIRHQFSVCPGPRAFAAAIQSSPCVSSLSSDGGGAVSDQILQLSTVQFGAITASVSLPGWIGPDKPMLKTEISIMEIPELVADGGGGSDEDDDAFSDEASNREKEGDDDEEGKPANSRCSSDSSISSTTVAIGINDGVHVNFIHVRLGVPRNQPHGWATTSTQQIKPQGSKKQRREMSEAVTSLQQRNCCCLRSSEHLENDLWKDLVAMTWQHRVTFHETVLQGSTNAASHIPSGTSNTLPNTSSTNTSSAKSAREMTHQHLQRLSIAIRIPAQHFEFDDVLSTFLTKHKLPISSIADYYIQKVVDIGHCVDTTDNILERNKNKAFSSSYTEIPCISPYLPNEPGLVFAVVIQFHYKELQNQKIVPGYQQEEDDKNNSKYYKNNLNSDQDPLFKTGIVAIFIHISAKTGLSHILTELSWPEFKDTREDYELMYHHTRWKSPLEVLQEEVALPSAFENSLMVLTNEEMVRERGSLKSLYHPVLPQWLLGFHESIEVMQELVRRSWEASRICAGLGMPRGRYPVGPWKDLERRW